MGMLAALGMRFYDEEDRLLYGYGKDLSKIDRISAEGLDSRLSDCHILIASDVQNPLCGPQGATAIYGPQKGATSEQVAALDEALENYSERLSQTIGRNAKELPGAGAAGGAGYALLSLGAESASGAEVIASASRLKEKLVGADWVITGEGKSDHQTLYGKLPIYVARCAKEAGVRTILLSGSLGERAEDLEREFAACFACVPRPMTLTECIEEAESSLRSSARNVIRLIQQ
jgi:glycerate kinase